MVLYAGRVGRAGFRSGADWLNAVRSRLTMSKDYYPMIEFQ